MVSSYDSPESARVATDKSGGIPMNERRVSTVVLVLSLLAAAGLTGCSEAKAEPIELTYYYLPG
jgi:hypothetical protein